MPTSRDLALDANYDLALQGQDLAPLVADDASIISDVTATIKLVAGEWFLDQSQGIPWLRLFSTKAQPIQALQAQLFTAIGARLGISQVQKVNATQTRGSRTVTVKWTASADEALLGSTVQVSP